MKKIIDGKVYNTETAAEILTVYSGNDGDLSEYTETLYKTKRGSFFLAGRGGPMTKYAVKTGSNSWSSGKKIFPLSKSEAAAWLETWQDEYDFDFSELYEKFFAVTEA